MKLPLALRLALRFSRGRRRGGMVSLISLLSTVGIALGVAVLIVGLSAMNGFERELNNRILSVVPHGEISPVNPPWHGWQAALKRIEQVPGVAGAAPYIRFTGLVSSGAKLRAIQVQGVDPAAEARLSSLSRFVLDNAWQKFHAASQQVILGQGVAQALHVKPGDWISVMIPNISYQQAVNDPGDASGHQSANNPSPDNASSSNQSSNNQSSNNQSSQNQSAQQPPQTQSAKLLQPKRIRLQVIGILQLSGQLDHSLALIPLKDAQHYLAMGNNISGIAIKTNNPFAAERLVRAAGEAAHNYVYIKSWISNYGYMYRDIQMIRAIMYLAMVLVIGVACFNIVSTLVMAVKDKSNDIAVLRTLGAGNRLIRSIFIWYGLLAGLSGSLAGTLIGSLLAWKLTPLVSLMEKLTGHQLLSGDIYFINFLPSELHWLDICLVLLTSLALSLLASWYPARRASQLDPARVLSGQ